ncbi:MAG: TetR/AcrR family transcriptional regulator [Bacteroidota bacterium]
MNTKENILATALHLFNRDGLDKVSLRAIAREMDISDGNLRYHYNSKAVLVEALYFRLVDRLNQMFGKLGEAAQPDLRLLYQSLLATFELLDAWRFLMLDFARLMRAHPRILTHFRELQKARRMMFQAVLQKMQVEGLMVEMENETFMNLLDRGQILSDFWIASAEILYEGPTDRRLQHYAQLMFSGIKPFLTKEGLKVYEEILAKG